MYSLHSKGEPALGEPAASIGRVYIYETLGTIAGGDVHLVKGDLFALTAETVEGNVRRVSVNYALLIQELQVIY